MTEVEAAEIVLGGHFYDTCKNCGGEGILIQVHDEVTSCGKCFGSGKTLTPKAVEAFVVLGLPEPQPATRLIALHGYESWTR